MNKKLLTIALATASPFFSLSVSAATIPSGFTEFYQIATKQSMFRGLDGRLYPVVVQAGYDTLQLDPTQAPAMRELLLNEGISASAIEEMIADLAIGVSNQTNCPGDISDCAIIPDSYEFYFDYFDNTIYLFVNPSLLDRVSNFDDEIVYAEPSKEKLAFINHIDMYANVSQDDEDDYDTSFSISDRSILGLPYGHISSDVYYTNSGNDDDFELNELLYNLEYQNFYMTAGLARDTKVSNATNFLASTGTSQELAVTIGTSKNLALNNKNTAQKLYYFAPNDGVLTVYRDDRIIYQRNVTSGQGYITNNDLPKGRYTAVFEITSGDQIVSSEIQNVYNLEGTNIPVGGVDATVSVGSFKRSYESYYDQQANGLVTEQIDSDLEDEMFARALFAYRPLDEMILGFGSIASERDSSLVAGVQLFLPFDARIITTAQVYVESGYYYDTQLDIFGFSTSYQEYKAEDDAVMGKYYFGDNSYKQLIVSKGFGITERVRGYSSYTYNESEGRNQDDVNRSSILSVGLSGRVYKNITAQLNVDYDFEAAKNNQDEYRAQFVVNVPFGDVYSYESRVNMTGSEMNNWQNTLRARDLFNDNPNFDLSASLTHTYTPNAADSENFVDGSLSANLTQPQYRLGGYSYFNQDGDVSASLNLSSSQIITSDGIAFTKDQSDSYLVVDAQGRLDDNIDEGNPKGLLIIESDQNLLADKKYIYDDKSVVPLKNYDTYRAYVDTDSLDLSNEGETFASTYTTPGTVQYIKTDITRVLSFVSGFKDLFENTVYGIRCIGDGCIASDEVVGGIYKVSVKEGQAFRLATDNLNCYIPPVDGSGLYNFGMNYCLPKVEPMEQFITRNGDSSITVTFVGGFKLAEYNELVRSRLMQIAQQNSEQEIIEKVIGDNIFVYVKFDQDTLTAQQRDVLSDLQQYVQLDILLDDTREYILVQESVITTDNQG